MAKTRPAAVAGLFYPAEPERLGQEVHALLRAAPHGEIPVDRVPKAIVVPHAGYVYSGPVAAAVYDRIVALRYQVTRVVLLGPTHRVAFRGIAAPSVEWFETPLGAVRVDQTAIAAIADLPQVIIDDRPHSDEHALEVQLPFLQTVLGDVTVVPLLVGDASERQVEEVIDTLWGGDETLIVVSTDLSHYHDYQTARQLDSETLAAVEHLDASGLDYEHACGRLPLVALLNVARRKGLQVQTVAVQNSGDTAGPKDQVVGYGGWALYKPAQANP